MLVDCGESLVSRLKEREFACVVLGIRRRRPIGDRYTVGDAGFQHGKLVDLPLNPIHRVGPGDVVEAVQNALSPLDHPEVFFTVTVLDVDHLVSVDIRELDGVYLRICPRHPDRAVGYSRLEQRLVRDAPLFKPGHNVVREGGLRGWLRLHNRFWHTAVVMTSAVTILESSGPRTVVTEPCPLVGVDGKAPVRAFFPATGTIGAKDPDLPSRPRWDIYPVVCICVAHNTTCPALRLYSPPPPRLFPRILAALSIHVLHVATQSFLRLPSPSQ